MSKQPVTPSPAKAGDGRESGEPQIAVAAEIDESYTSAVSNVTICHNMMQYDNMTIKYDI